MALTEEQKKKLFRAYRYSNLRWTLQTGGPFLLVVLTFSWLPILLVPFCVYFVPPHGHLRFRGGYGLTKAIVDNGSAVNLIMGNAFTLFMGLIIAQDDVGKFISKYPIVAFASPIAFIVWCLLPGHPVRRLIYWPSRTIARIKEQSKSSTDA